MSEHVLDYIVADRLGEAKLTGLVRECVNVLAPGWDINVVNFAKGIEPVTFDVYRPDAVAAFVHRLPARKSGEDFVSATMKNASRVPIPRIAMLHPIRAGSKHPLDIGAEWGDEVGEIGEIDEGKEVDKVKVINISALNYSRFKDAAAKLAKHLCELETSA